ncbi:hypothetical protein [Microbacterium phyllosphaerae]|uniref:hypothetical protein n=1 Tax=Microbacterium phyllosphaerae TaxID=124798 RepID=UPI003D64D562
MPISALPELGAPGCDLVGSTLTFEELEGRFDTEAVTYPGGIPSLTITAVGATFAQGDGHRRELMMVNWGVPGVAVALIDNGQLVEVWASSDAALDLHLEALEADGIPIE